MEVGKLVGRYPGRVWDGGCWCDCVEVVNCDAVSHNLLSGCGMCEVRKVAVARTDRPDSKRER